MGRIFQSRLKKIIIYSSIFTTAWAIRAIVEYNLLWRVVLAIYSVLLGLFINNVNTRIIFLKETQDYLINSSSNKVLQFLVIISIGGIPPIAIFFIKIIILLILYEKLFYFYIIILTFRSVIILYIYVNIFLSALTFSSPFLKRTIYIKIRLSITLIIFFILCLGPIILFL